MTLNLLPILSSSLVNIRPLVSEDFDGLYDAAKDPDIWAGMPAKNRWQPEVFKKWFDYLINTDALAILDGKKIICTTKYYYMSDNRLFMGSTFLAREYWGGKYNREFRYMLINHAFEHVDKIHIHISPDNPRNQRATEKLGFTHEYNEYVQLRRPEPQLQMTYVLHK